MIHDFNLKKEDVINIKRNEMDQKYIYNEH